jgi:hypothetical protein
LSRASQLDHQLEVLVSSRRPVSSSNDGLTTDFDAVSGEEDDAWILDECYEEVEDTMTEGLHAVGLAEQADRHY